jgi:hypothetical protein
MRTTPVVLAVLAAAAAGSLCRHPAARAASVPDTLTPATFDAIRSRVALTPQELAWQKIPWRDGFFQGLLEAQAADKPIFYWLYEGHPRGKC